MLECSCFVYGLHPLEAVNEVRFNHLLFLRFIDSFFSPSVNAHLSQRKELVLRSHFEASSTNMKKKKHYPFNGLHYYPLDMARLLINLLLLLRNKH